MKKEFVKYIIKIIIIIAICFSLSNSCFAANTTNETSNTQNSFKSETTKSSNANLKILGIKPHDFTGFRYGTTTYNVTVPENTKTIEVYAEVQDSNAKVTGTGTKNLEDTKTSVDVVVTAEDGTKKTYTINITKGEVQNESSKNEVTSNNSSKENSTNAKTETKSNGLSILKINELNLVPDFETNVYEYKVEYTGKENKLEIKAEPTNSEYVVEIIGNKDLEDGENIITILVSDKDAENIATYQITVNKNIIDESNSKNIQKYIIWGIIGVILLVVIVFIIKKKGNKEYKFEENDENDEFDTYGNSFNNNIERENAIKKEDNEDELPKALRSKHKYENKYDYEEITKEDARKNFLDGYDNNINNDFDYKAEKIKNKHRGKRFK